MFTTRTTESCRHCGMAAAECGARGMFRGAGACCWRCRPFHRAHRERVERVEVPEPEPTAAVVSVAPEVLDRAAEDELVASILRAAEAEAAVVGGLVERFDQPGVAAYRSLARSRGLDLDVVVTAAVRGRLADVVRRPAVATDEPPDPATAGPTSTTREGDHEDAT